MVPWAVGLFVHLNFWRNNMVSCQKWTSLVAQMIKNLAAMQDTQVWSLGRENPPEKGMPTHSSILVWRIPRGAWRATVHGVAESQTQLRNWAHSHILSTHTYFFLSGWFVFWQCFMCLRLITNIYKIWWYYIEFNINSSIKLKDWLCCM